MGEEKAKPQGYEKIALEIGQLLNAKQLAYGRSFNEIPAVIRLMYPDGILPSQYPNILTIARVLDKLWRIARDNDPYGESPWDDIAGYALLRAQEVRKEREEDAKRDPA